MTPPHPVSPAVADRLPRHPGASCRAAILGCCGLLARHNCTPRSASPTTPLALLAILLLTAPLRAHELQDNRATLVLRDKTHLSLTIYVAYAEILHQFLAPQRPLPEFLMVYSALKPEDIQRQLQRAQSHFQSTTHLYAQSGEIPIANWVWPDAKQTQAMMQQRIMQAMVDPAGHAHDQPLEIHAEAVAPQEVTAVRAQFPDEFQRVLVVAYRPNQTWSEPKTGSPTIKF